MLDEQIYTIREAKTRLAGEPCKRRRGHTYAILESSGGRPRLLVCSHCGNGWKIKRG